MVLVASIKCMVINTKHLTWADQNTKLRPAPALMNVDAPVCLAYHLYTCEARLPLNLMTLLQLADCVLQSAADTLPSSPPPSWRRPGALLAFRPRNAVSPICPSSCCSCCCMRRTWSSSCRDGTRARQCNDSCCCICRLVGVRGSAKAIDISQARNACCDNAPRSSSPCSLDTTLDRGACMSTDGL